MNSKKLKTNENIFSKKDDIVIKAIETIREAGNIKDLENLAKKYSETDSEEIKTLIFNVFADLKIQEAANTVVDLIKSVGDADTVKMLVSSCWQSRLDYADYFETFIDLVISAPFEISFDAFTVLENFENKIQEERKAELIDYVKSNIAKSTDDNKTFATELINIIEKY